MERREKLRKLFSILLNHNQSKCDLMEFSALMLNKTTRNVDYAQDIRIVRELQKEFPLIAESIGDYVSDYRDSEAGYKWTNIYKEFFLAMQGMFNMDNQEDCDYLNEVLEIGRKNDTSE